MAQPARALVHRRLDGWLLGGIAVLAWIGLRVAGGGPATPLGGWIMWILAAIAGAHFALTYHLAYADGVRSLRAHPIALVAVPVAIVVGAVALLSSQALWPAATTRAVVGDLFLLVFSLTGWHYVKQTFGIGMVTARARGWSLTRREVQVLRYGLYPVWLYQALAVWERGNQVSYRAIVFTPQLVPPGGRSAVGVVGLAGAATAAVVLVRLALRHRELPPAGLWATYLAGGLWLLATPSLLSVGLVLSALHGMQYLVLVHRADLDRAAERGERDLATWWLCVLAGAVGAGLLLTMFVPGLLDRNASMTSTPGLCASLLFVALNLHHYAIDAVIWRSSGEHVRRIVHGPARAAEPSPVTEAAELAPAPA